MTNNSQSKLLTNFLIEFVFITMQLYFTLKKHGRLYLQRAFIYTFSVKDKPRMQGFHFVFEQQMNPESQQMAGGPGGRSGPLVGPGKARWRDQGGNAPRKLLGFQQLNELLVHVFLPIFASIFTCITACCLSTYSLKTYLHVHVPEKKILHFQIFVCFIFRKSLLLGFFKQKQIF